MYTYIYFSYIYLYIYIYIRDRYNLFIIILDTYIYTNILFLYLISQIEDSLVKKEKTLDTHHLKAIQETIGGFLNDQVLTPGGEFYYDPNM